MFWVTIDTDAVKAVARCPSEPDITNALTDGSVADAHVAAFSHGV
jgi:hypothetical protein